MISTLLRLRNSLSQARVGGPRLTSDALTLAQVVATQALVAATLALVVVTWRRVVAPEAPDAAPDAADGPNQVQVVASAASGHPLQSQFALTLVRVAATWTPVVATWTSVARPLASWFTPQARERPPPASAGTTVLKGAVPTTWVGTHNTTLNRAVGSIR